MACHLMESSMNDRNRQDKYKPATRRVQVLFHTGREDDPVPGSIGVAVLNRCAQGTCKALIR